MAKKISTEVPVCPLSEPVFERMNSLNPPSLRSLKQPVVWNEDVYTLGRDCGGYGKLYKYSLSNNEWSSFSVSHSIYASNSVLIVYNSKLLLISGMELTLWEFSNSDFSFKESCIKPIPRSGIYDILATSSDEYLIIAMSRYRRPYNLLIYNGRDWKFRRLNIKGRLLSGVVNDMAAIDSHAVYNIIHHDWCNDISIQRALIPSFDEIKDEDMATILWEELEMMSLEEFDELLCGRKYSIIIQDQQFYCVGSKGIIFTAFVQPPIVPMVWGSSCINFHQAPHLVGLPNGALLMIGTIGNQDGESQLDVIKVSHRGSIIIMYDVIIDHGYNPDSHLTMNALITLERRMNVPVLTKLQSNFRNLMKLTGVHAKQVRRQTRYYMIGVLESWINSTESVPEPTWRNFFRVLKDTSPELGELVYQIKEIFHATEAAEDTAKLKAQLIHLWSSSKSAEEMTRGLESSIALCEDILQKIQKSDEEREQLAKQLQSKAEEVTKLNEQLKLYEKAGTNTSNIGSNFSVASSSVLGEDHLRDVVREMTPGRSSYYALGRQLGLPVGTLESIKKQYESTDLDRALNEVLLAWLHQRYNTAALGKPSWQMLVRAVADQGGLNDPALAIQIASRHTSPPPEQ